MLVLGRKNGEDVYLTLTSDPEKLRRLQGLELRLVLVRGEGVRLGLDAPRDLVQIVRGEIREPSAA